MKQSLKAVGFFLSIFFSSINQADPGKEAARKHARAKFGIVLANQPIPVLPAAKIGKRTEKSITFEPKDGHYSPTPPNSPRSANDKIVRFLTCIETVALRLENNLEN